MTAPVRLVYFAWVRERIGFADETVELPEHLGTVGDLVAWLAGRGDNFAYALEQPAAIRVALDQMHVAHDEPLGSPREIALFPPMTGG
ncbi:molybdopterin converting factor subunit 1 [Oharaeibacter diazotrophicus]|uniref:Molybdopterin synthase subunit MoaD n=1 Tax=Oharaeibacter diazotrophicus TaxID=1920512 RepID=A0A4R6RA30_9HYPH|nr:molybdopterin converting factor subunit 1 [Oharaeibacter diazotrophicus]TDP82487.1 molybdopterin synthase subunit MoaD [Oharaeibacter diazotrophicus]BBE72749.1 molybdopterin synthase sulfur carrier subunit [Pleomorphomonas sp. SM30]GLS76785.1 molybdopterin synthase sulfur carrier subunit [Oharaeibacter diazotrophicus]